MRWQLYVGLLLAVMGGGLVTLYKPNPAPAPKAAQEKPAAVVSSRQMGLRGKHGLSVPTQSRCTAR